MASRHFYGLILILSWHTGCDSTPAFAMNEDRPRVAARYHTTFDSGIRGYGIDGLFNTVRVPVQELVERLRKMCR